MTVHHGYISEVTTMHGHWHRLDGSTGTLGTELSPLSMQPCAPTEPRLRRASEPRWHITRLQGRECESLGATLPQALPSRGGQSCHGVDATFAAYLFACLMLRLLLTV